MTPQKRQAPFWNQWNVVKTSAGGSKTIRTRQHPELAQAHRGRMNSQSGQRATASQAGSSFASTVTSKELFYSSECDQETCYLSVWCRTAHSRSPHHLSSICFQSHDALTSLRCHLFWYFVCLELEEPGWKQSNHRCAKTHIIFATHLGQLFIHRTETDGTLMYRRSSPLLLWESRSERSGSRWRTRQRIPRKKRGDRSLVRDFLAHRSSMDARICSG